MPRVGVVRGVLLAACGAICLAALAFAASSITLFRHTPSAAGRIAANPAQVTVLDAGTLRLNQQVIVLLGVEPPPRGKRCGAVADCGATAANALAELIRDKPVSCALLGSDAMGRPLGLCLAGGTDLNRAVIAAGWARAGSERPELRQVEAGARADRRGLWAER